MGRSHAYDHDAAEDFADLLRRWGPPGFRAEKERLWAAVTGNMEPGAYQPARTRTARTATRVALRQLAARQPGLPGLQDWLAALDRAPAR